MSIPFLSDLGDALTPFKTGDYGVFEYRWCDEDEFEAAPADIPWTSHANTSAAVRAIEAQPEPAMSLEMQQSLQLIPMIQRAIERREAALRNVQASDAARAMLSGPTGSRSSRRNPNYEVLGRLALEPYTDQALAKEDMAEADLLNSRVDMTDLLPPDLLGDHPLSQSNVRLMQQPAPGAASSIAARFAGGAGVAQDESDNSSYSYYSDYEPEDPQQPQAPAPIRVA